MKKITTLLIALACVAMAANATVTINVRTSTGTAPFIYAWVGDPVNGEWPGTQMNPSQTSTTEDGLVWFTQDFDYDAINIVLNDGGIDGEEPFVQTQDLLGITGTVYYIFDPEEGGFEDVTGNYIEIQEFDPSTLPSEVVFVEGKEFAYFVAPASWTKCDVWVWSNTTGTNFTNSGAWPGDPITLVGNTTDGAPVFQWIGADIVETDRPTHIIFNNTSGTQTADLVYVAGGVYDLTGKLLYTVTPGGGDTPIPGDVNGDGNVTAADITALYDFMLTNDDSHLINGDQNGDGNITAADVTAVYDILLGLTN